MNKTATAILICTVLLTSWSGIKRIGLDESRRKGQDDFIHDWSGPICTAADSCAVRVRDCGKDVMEREGM